MRCLALSVFALCLVIACERPSSPETAPARGKRAEPRTTIVGIARNGKAGASVMVDGAPVYVDGLTAWPSTLVGSRVFVTGSLVTRQGLPQTQPLNDAVGGLVGPYRVITNARWHRDTSPVLTP